VASPTKSALHESLLTALGTAIVSGRYPAGEVLTLDGICAVSRLSCSALLVGDATDTSCHSFAGR
jgi:DNA-binding GntR family transcriptional regulator